METVVLDYRHYKVSSSFKFSSEHHTGALAPSGTPSFVNKFISKIVGKENNQDNGEDVLIF